MTTSQDVAVTYTGTDDPFKDRIYRSGLTFTPGQTRMLPEPLAVRFLQHQDVFKRGDAAKPADTDPDGQEQKAVDDTQRQLEAAETLEDTQRQQENARFDMLDSIESMDRAALISWADQHYQQKIPGNVSVAKARDMARGFIDQYGMPA